MANFTSNAIKETFIEMLEEQPLTEITVKDIVKRCKINRNTFYYHYRDLPSLIEEIIHEEAESIIKKYPSVTSIVECFDALTEFASHRKRAIMHIYRSVNREVFERYLMSVSYYFIKCYADTVLDEVKIGQEYKNTVVTYYKSVCFGLVMEWLNCNMSEEFAKEVRKIFLLKKDTAEEIANFLQGQV